MNALLAFVCLCVYIKFNYAYQTLAPSNKLPSANLICTTQESPYFVPFTGVLYVVLEWE